MAAGQLTFENPIKCREFLNNVMNYRPLKKGSCYTDIRNYLVRWSVGRPVKQILRELLCVNLNPFWLLKLF